MGLLRPGKEFYFTDQLALQWGDYPRLFLWAREITSILYGAKWQKRRSESCGLRTGQAIADLEDVGGRTCTKECECLYNLALSCLKLVTKRGPEKDLILPTIPISRK